MEYRLKVTKNDIHLDVEIQENQDLKIAAGGKESSIRYTLISKNWIHLTVTEDGHTRQVNAYVSRHPEGKTVIINGRTYEVLDLDAPVHRTGSGTPHALPDRVTPPMPAVVVRILVEIGDHVEKGQGVIVVSAMKMETTLCAPFDGTVTGINTAVNNKVTPGQVLVEIKKKQGV